MKANLVKKIISKKGLFDRELLVELMKPNRFGPYIWKWKFYRKFMKALMLKKHQTPVKIEIHAMERMGKAFSPIPTNPVSKILKKIRGWKMK